MKIKKTSRGYEATVTVPVVSASSPAPELDDSGESPLGYNEDTQSLMVWDRETEAWVAPSGGAVVTDGSLTGDGTAEDPLTVAASGGTTFATPGVIVWAAIDPVAGVDATGTMSTTLATATAAPYKTLTKLLSAMPRFGNVCSFVCLMKAGTHLKPDGVTIDDIDLTGFTGYRAIIFRGSDFTNTTSDKLRVAGAVIAGTSTQGYTLVANTITPSAVDFTVSPVSVTAAAHGLTTGDKVSGRGFTGGATFSNGMLNGYWTVTVTSSSTFTLDTSLAPPGVVTHTYNPVGTFIRYTLTDKSGSPVSLTSGALIGKRFRFDSATTTTAARDLSVPIIDNDTTHVLFQSSPATAVSALDFGYFEEPGAIVGVIRTSPYGPATSGTAAPAIGTQFAGIAATTVLSRGTNDRFAFCEQTLTTSGTFSVANTIGGGLFTVSTSWLDETLGTARQTGTGMRARSANAAITGNCTLGTFFHMGTGGLTVAYAGIPGGIIQNGYYGTGLVLNNCGGRGAGPISSNGNMGISAASAAFARGPRIIGSASVNALYVLSSSVYVNGADLSGATGGLSAIRVGGYSSSVNIDNVSGHNNSVSIGLSPVSSSDLGVTRSKVAINTSAGNFGLYSFSQHALKFPDNGGYTDNLYELLLLPNKQGIIDSYDNSVFDVNASAQSSGSAQQLAKTAGYIRNLVGTLPRGMLLKFAPDFQGYIGAGLAIADTEASTRLTAGIALGTVVNTDVLHYVTFGQVGYCFVDLTGGHVAAAQASPVYLSQTRAGYAQADKPASGQVMQLGVALFASDATTGLTPVLLMKSV